MNNEQDQCKTVCEQSFPSGPYGIAITGLDELRSVAYESHDIAIREGRYDDAKHFNKRVKSLAKAIHLLTAADKVHTQQ